jgi:hypothetical protein
MTSRFACALLVSAAACGSSNNTKPVDAAPTVPAHITITGTAKATGTSSTPLAGVAVTAYQAADENTAVATATSDSNGAFSLDVTTNGMPLDGYIKGTISGYLDLYLYPPAAITADYAGAAINMVNESTIELLSNLCGDAISATGANAKGAMGVEVADSTGTVVAGAVVTSTPTAAKYCYNGQNGLPSSSGTTTGADGLGYLIDLSGDVTVTATKAGSTFSNNKLKVRIGSLTTTIIEAQ